MKDRIRIVFFHIGSENFSGGSKMLYRLLCNLDSNKFEPVLLSNTEDELYERIQKEDIEVRVVPFEGALDTYDRRLLSDAHLLLPASIRILQFNQKTNSLLQSADVIWCENLRAVLTLFPYLAVTRTPTIWNVGLGLEPTGKVKILKSISLWVVDEIFIESHQQARQVFTEKQYKNNIKSLRFFHKGVDTEKFNPDRFPDYGSEKEFRVGTAALINPRKGLEYFVDAAAQILEYRSDVQFPIAGTPARESDKQYKQELEERAREHGIEEHIRFLGWVEDMPGYLSTLDVFVLPSYNEGIPGAVREALAMEVPTIATNVGGTSDVVLDGETGFLVEPEDADMIAEKILHLLTNPAERRKIGKRGREHIVNNFSISSYIHNYESFFEEITSK